MSLPTPLQGGPYAWSVPCDANGTPLTSYPMTLLDSSVLVDDSASGTNQAISATLPGVAGKTTFIQKVVVTVGTGTLSGSGELSISGINNGPWLYEIASLTTSGYSFEVDFGDRGRPASGSNTSIVASLTALGLTTGKVSITIHGKQV